MPITDACPHCGMHHAATCPRVRAMEYYPDGILKRVEFHEPPQAPPLGLTIRKPATVDPGVCTTWSSFELLPGN